MSTIDHNSITEKIIKLKQAIRNLNTLKKNPERIRDDEILQGSVMYYLFMGIEAILDIGQHILTEQFESGAEDYEGIIKKLNEKKVISDDLTKRSEGMGKFRNKMIHEYADIDMELIINYLKKAPDEFSLFENAYKTFFKNELGRK